MRSTTRVQQAPEPVDGHRPADVAVAGTTWLSGAGERAAFLLGFLRHPAQVGSVIPSSARLERRLVRNAGVADARLVVELGPGTGGTTRALLRAMRRDARLLAIEIDHRFHAHLSRSIRDPRLIAHRGRAEDIEQILAGYGLPAPDALVSGIPFSTMPAEVAQGIAATVARALAPQGRFVAYQVRDHVAGYATPFLGPPVREWEWINIPPVRVFTWRRAWRTGDRTGGQMPS